MAEKIGDVILNVAVGDRYAFTQRRMIFFLSQIGDDTPQLFWTDSWPGRPHSEAPYGFKIDAFDAAIKLGYRRALWLDSPVYPVKELDEVWSYLDQHGVLLLGDGWNVGQWTSDAALAMYGVDRNDAMNMQLCYACVVGIDLASEIGTDVSQPVARAARCRRLPWALAEQLRRSVARSAMHGASPRPERGELARARHGHPDGPHADVPGDGNGRRR